jgi:hypothetical protein
MTGNHFKDFNEMTKQHFKVTEQLKESYRVIDRLKSLMDDSEQRFEKQIAELRLRVRQEQEVVEDLQEKSFKKLKEQGDAMHKHQVHQLEAQHDSLRQENHKLRLEITDKQETYFKTRYQLDVVFLI